MSSAYAMKLAVGCAIAFRNLVVETINPVIAGFKRIQQCALGSAAAAAWPIAALAGGHLVRPATTEPRRSAVSQPTSTASPALQLMPMGILKDPIDYSP